MIDPALSSALATTVLGVILRLLGMYDKRQAAQKTQDALDVTKAEMQSQAEKAKADMIEQSARLAKHTEEQTSQVLGEIRETRDDLKVNTQISVKAFTEANNYNLKIAKLHDRIDGVVNDTNAGFTAIHEMLAKRAA